MRTSAIVAALLVPTIALAEDAPMLVATGATGGSINSLGEVMWSQTDPATGQQQLFSSKRGQLSYPQYNTYPQYNQYPHSAPSLNNMGDVAWIVGNGYGSAANLGGSISGRQIDGLRNMPPIVGPDSDPDINDRQEVVWTTYDAMTMTSSVIYSNVRGKLTTDLSNHYRPSINNNGDVVFIQYDMGPGQVYKIPSGSTIAEPVTSDNLDHVGVAINDNGEMVWAVRDVAGTSIVSTSRGVLPIAVAGDLSRVDLNNCGDVVYSVTENGVPNVYRWGNNAPCVSGGQNVSQSQAAAVHLGDIFTGAVDAASATRWYKFDALAGKKIQISANYDTRSPNALAIGLYDGQGNLVSGPTSSSPLSIITSASYSGTYYLKAQATSGAFAFYVSLSQYSQNCGAGPCQESVAYDTVATDIAINSLGEAVWRQYDPATRKYLVVSSTRGVLPVTIQGDNSGPVAINNHGDVAWVDSGYPSYLRTFIAGQEATVASADYFAAVGINDVGEIIWNPYDTIYSNLRGKLTDTSVSAVNGSLNNQGDIVFVDGNMYATMRIPGGSTTVELADEWARGWWPRVTDSGEIISPYVDENNNNRFFSSVQGDLPYVVPGWLNTFDVNSCGDLLFSLYVYPSATNDIFRIGQNAPCMTEPTRAYAVAVSRAADATGGGTVASSPAGITLAAADNLKVATFQAGTLVTLTATPDANSVFVGWAGACSGNGVCQVTVDQAKSVQAVFTVGTDTTPPTVTITSPTAGFSTSYGSQIIYSVSDGTVVTKIDGVVRPVESGAWLGFVDGTHVVRVESRDASGNLGFAEVTFTVDTVPPAISLTSPASGVTNVNNPVLNYTVSEGTVVIRLDGQVVSKVSGDTLGPLKDGYHSVRIESTDAAGNFSYADRSFTVDTTPPNIIISQPTAGLIASNTPTLSYAVYGGSPAVVKVDGVVVNKVPGDSLDTLAEGPHTLRIESTDAVGNAGFEEVSFTVDSLAPVINFGAPAAGYTKVNTPVLSYTIDEANLSTVQVLLDQAGTGKVSGDTLGPLTDGAHSVTVQTTDKLGRFTEASVRFVVDTTPPSISIAAPASGFIKNNTPLLSYNVADANAVTVVVKVDGAVVDKVSGSTLDALADGYHTVRVEGTDAAGNFSAGQANFTVDTAAPVVAISSPVAGTTPDHTPYLNYTSTEGNVVVKVDGISVSTRSGSSLSALANGSHTLTVQSTDAAGNIGVATVTFTVDYTPLYLTPSSFSYGVVGTSYSQRLAATGGVRPYTWSVNSGSLPPGLSLNPATGEIAGVPTAAGSFPVSLKIADSDGESAIVSGSIQVYTPVAIASSTVPSGYVGEAYTGSVSAAGGAGNYVWSVASGNLPPGLLLDPFKGTISGTPSGSPSAVGTFTFTIQATDRYSAASQTVTMVINPARPDLVITSVSGPISSGAGRKVTLYATVTNRGAGTAPASTLHLYLSNDSSITSGDIHLAIASVGSLFSGSSQVVAVTTNLPKTLAAGNYYFGAIADDPAAIEESNETNNAQLGNMVSVK